ncbi:MAG: cation diffusion facilitator family transporter [Acidimicrobiia bacterium]|nr:cation diffusion facilitator family transporter [Acidimicrobiia bacterium]
MAGHGTKAIVAAFFANLGIAIAKFIAFAFTGAASMLAEAIHSLADTGNQALLLFGGRSARREETEMHQFGFARERYFWSFVVALVLFTLGGVFAIYEGIEKLRHPHDIDSPIWAFGVLLFAILLESYSFRTAIHEARPLKGKGSWWSFIRRSRSPELPVVLLEDLGALTGLVIALVGVTLAVTTGQARWDAAGSLAIGILLVAIATILAIEMRSLLIGESASPDQADEITAAIAGAPNVVRLIHMRTEHLGPEDLLVAAKVEFVGSLSVAALADAIDVTEAAIRAAVPAVNLIYLEPDLYNAARPTDD